MFFNLRKTIFIFSLLSLPFLAQAQDFSAYAKLSDQEIIEKFSSSFLAFDNKSCYFVNNQGFNFSNESHDGYDFMCLPNDRAFDMTFNLPLEILDVGYDNLYGHYVLAKDLTGRFTFIFGHSVQINAKKGEIYDATHPLLKVGNTGYSFGAHLHVEIYKNGLPVQLDDSIYQKFNTIYKKVEIDPATALAKSLGITKEQAQEQYLQYIDNKIYPLDWFKIFAIARYESSTVPQIIKNLQGQNFLNFTHSRYYIENIKKPANKWLAEQQLAKLRAYYTLTQNQRFQTIETKEWDSALKKMMFRGNWCQAHKNVCFPPIKPKVAGRATIYKAKSR